jgi:hypothetical protein
VFLTTLAIFTICLNSLWASDHPTSFLELDWAIWHDHTFALAKVNSSLTAVCGGSPIRYGSQVVCTVDDFTYGGYYYSALAPGTAFLMLPFAIVGFAVQGGFSLYQAPLIYSEFFVALANSFATLLVYKICKLYFKETTSVLVALGYAFSTISWPFGTFVFQSDPSAAFDLLAMFFALKITKGEKAMELRWYWLTGIALAISVVIDYVNAILIPIFLFYVLFSIRKKEWRTIAEGMSGLFVGALVGGVMIGAYNYVNFGSAFKTTEGLYRSGGLFSSFSEPLDYGLLLNLFTPYRGLFIYSPILVLGVVGFAYMLRSDELDKDGIFMLAVFLSILFPYSKWYDLDAGLSYGPRFIVAAIPFLLIPTGFVIDRPNRRNVVIAYVLYSVGVVTNGIAALTSALAGTNSNWLRSPFLDSALPFFVKGTFDSWFLSSFPSGYWDHVAQWTFAIGIIAIALVMPVISYRRLGGYESSLEGR